MKTHHKCRVGIFTTVFVLLLGAGAFAQTNRQDEVATAQLFGLGVGLAYHYRQWQVSGTFQTSTQGRQFLGLQFGMSF